MLSPKQVGVSPMDLCCTLHTFYPCETESRHLYAWLPPQAVNSLEASNSTSGPCVISTKPEKKVSIQRQKKKFKKHELESNRSENKE